MQKHQVVNPDCKPNTPDYEYAGTAPFDIFPSYDEWIANFMMDREPEMHALAQYHFGHLPAWVDGNAYFNGANVSRHEKHGLIEKDAKVIVELEEVDGKCVLKTNLYDFLGDFRDGIITTDTLGKAFEPEERFENTDGTDIIFDRDYFGGHRGLATLPGPFAEGGKEWKVW